MTRAMSQYILKSDLAVMHQPIKKTSQSANIQPALPPFNTLLVDGSSLLETVFYVDDEYNSQGQRVGGVYKFLYQMSKLMSEKPYQYVYVFWDGMRAGQLRYELNSDYKANRDKTYDEAGQSDYMKAYNERLRNMQAAIYKKKKPQKSQTEQEEFYHEREILKEVLEELFIRQCENDIVEADDFIAYYTINRQSNEFITIASTDRDLTQLIDDHVAVRVFGRQNLLLTHETHRKIMGYTHENVLVKKVICGDTSDNIKGITGVGIQTLTTNIPELADKKMSLNEIIERVQGINDDRVKIGKKPLKWVENILNRVTTGAPGKHIFEINERIIDLHNPMMTSEAIDNIEAFRYAPLDAEDRGIGNAYAVLRRHGVEKLFNENYFAVFMQEFAKHIEFEKKNA